MDMDDRAKFSAESYGEAFLSATAENCATNEMMIRTTQTSGNAPIAMGSSERKPTDSCKLLRAHLTNMNGCVAGDLVLRQDARSENILYGPLSDERRRSGAKDPATLRAEFWPTGWRRCFSVTEPYGYAPSSRRASRPPETQRTHSYL
jgi:hypothetical protein